MVWKCPSCSFKSRNYQTMMKHYYRQHYTPKKGSKSVPKGKDNKIHRFKPIKRRK